MAKQRRASAKPKVDEGHKLYPLDVKTRRVPDGHLTAKEAAYTLGITLEELRDLVVDGKLDQPLELGAVLALK